MTQTSNGGARSAPAPSMTASEAYGLLCAPFVVLEAHDAASAATLGRATATLRALVASLPIDMTHAALRSLAMQQAAAEGDAQAVRDLDAVKNESKRAAAYEHARLLALGSPVSWYPGRRSA